MSSRSSHIEVELDPGESIYCPNCGGSGDDPDTMICCLCGGEGKLSNDDDEPVVIAMYGLGEMPL